MTVETEEDIPDNRRYWRVVTIAIVVAVVSIVLMINIHRI